MKSPEILVEERINLLCKTWDVTAPKIILWRNMSYRFQLKGEITKIFQLDWYGEERLTDDIMECIEKVFPSRDWQAFYDELDSQNG